MNTILTSSCCDYRLVCTGVVALCRLAATLTVVALVSACSSPPEVRTATAQQGTVEATVSSVNSGTVKAEQVAELSFGAVGRVSKLNVLVGSIVEQGRELAELENIDLRAILDVAERNDHRLGELLARNAIAPREREDAHRALELARANLEKSIIRAPFSGVIIERNVEVGQLSQITAVIPKPLLRIVDRKPRYVVAQIDEVDLPRITVGLPARVKILAVRREPFLATVRKVIPFVSETRDQDRTTEIELNLEQEEALLPVGASADVELIIETKESVLWIPTRTILGRGDNRYVFRYVDGRVYRTPLRRGLYNFERSEILDGLTEGDQVVFPSDIIELEDKMRVSISSKNSSAGN